MRKTSEEGAVPKEKEQAARPKSKKLTSSSTLKQIVPQQVSRVHESLYLQSASSQKHIVSMDEGSDFDDHSSISTPSPLQPPAWFVSLPEQVRANLLSVLSQVDLRSNGDREFLIRDCCAKFALSESHVEELVTWNMRQLAHDSDRSFSELSGQVMWSGETSQAYLYADEIYKNLLQTESRFQPSPDYMDTVQNDITHNMRSILVDWLVEVGEEYKLSSQTLFLTVNYIDRLLGLVSVNRNKLQLLGITCMLVGAKYEEIYPPSIDEFVYISDNTYSRREVLSMESVLLTSLQFNLAAPTPWEFTRRFCSAGNIDDKVKHLSFFLTELIMLYPAYLKHRPSILAAASIFLALYTLFQTPWTTSLFRASGFTEDALIDCVKDMHACHKRGMCEQQNLKAVREKFKDPKYHDVASIEVRPMLFGDYM